MRVDSREVYEEEFALRRKLVDIRDREHLTQKQLAEMTGLSQQMISRIEIGEGNTTIETLLKYLNGLGYRIEVVKK